MSSTEPEAGRYSARQYLEMTECGVIADDERVELLDGLIVASPPPSPPHDAAVHRVLYALLRRLGLDVALRVRASFLAGASSVPQPDLALVPGDIEDYREHHPSRALLIVEVAQTSVSQDRLTKAAIYARAGVPCYWVVNLRDHCVEVFREPDRFSARYATTTRASGDDVLVIDAFPSVRFRASELLPPS